jgi:hypothetical protein
LKFVSKALFMQSVAVEPNVVYAAGFKIQNSEFRMEIFGKEAGIPEKIGTAAHSES